jgi:hypothetical protein
VFEYLDLDLKKYMDNVKNNPLGFTPEHVKVCMINSCSIALFTLFL